MTTTAKICPRCGSLLSAASLEGLCARCLTLSLFGDSPAPESTPSLKQSFFGDYELLDEIGRGGSGIVFKARQLGVNRIVALKLLASGPAAARDFVHRFHTEAAAAAQLEHAHIVPIYEFGEHEGTHFLAMRYLEGGSLAHQLSQRKPANGSDVPPRPDTPVEGPVCHPQPREGRYHHFTAQGAAVLLHQIALAVEHAHRRGILHRDLKPGNILLDLEGIPYLCDFGLARVLEDDSSITLSRSILGTVGYLAPEIASQGVTAATTASDIYSLGAILYELLVGRPPFEKPSIAATLRTIIEQAATFPPQNFVAGNLKTERFLDLEIICLKCLEKDPALRYPTAQALADDLQRFTNNEPIAARPITGAAKLIRWCHRNPAFATACGFLAFFLILIAIGSPFALYRINQARAAETLARARAEQNGYASDMLLASEAFETKNYAYTRSILERYKSNQTLLHDARGWEWRYLWQQTRPSQISTLASFTNGAGHVCWPAKGKQIAIAPLPAAGDPLGTVQLVNRETEESFTSKIPGTLKALDVKENGSLIAVTRNKFALEVFTEGGSSTLRIPLGQDVPGMVCVSADHSTFAATSERWVKVWDLSTGTNLLNLISQFFVYNARLIALSPDGKNVAHSSFHNTTDKSYIVITEVATGRTLAELDEYRHAISALAFSPDGRILASGDDGGEVRLWDLDSFEPRPSLGVHLSSVSTLAFSRDGKLLASAGREPAIKIWDLTAEAAERVTLRGHTGAINALSFSPDGSELCSGSSDGTVRIWRSAPLQDELDMTVHSMPINAADISITGDGFWTFDGGDVLSVWNTSDLTRANFIHLPAQVAERIAFAPQAKKIALQWRNNDIGIYNVKPFELLQTVHGATNTITKLALSPDGKLLAVQRDDWAPHEVHQLSVWDLNSMRELTTESRHPDKCVLLRFALAADKLVAGYEDGQCEVWSVAKGHRMCEMAAHRSAVALGGFLQNGQRLVTGAPGNSDTEVKIWNLETGKLLGTLSAPVAQLADIAASADGSRLAIAGDDGTITIWDPNTYLNVAKFHAAKDPLFRVAFGPDGRSLLSISREWLRVWRAAPKDE